MRRASSFAEKTFLMLDAPQTESTTGKEGEDLFELICLTRAQIFLEFLALSAVASLLCRIYLSRLFRRLTSYLKR